MTQEKSASLHSHIAVLVLALFVGGFLAWPYYIRQKAFKEKENAILSIMPEIQQSFTDIRLVRSTHPDVWLFGTVESSAHLKKLREILLKRFSEEETLRITKSVRLLTKSASNNRIEQSTSK